MELPQRVQVLIVGLGPVGATVANLLGRHGVEALVVDQSTEILRAPRAIALDEEALRILQLAGLEDGAFATVAIPYVSFRSPLFGEFTRAETAGESGGHPRLVTFYQPELEEVLRARLRRYRCVRVETGVTVTAVEPGTDAVGVTLRARDGAAARVEASWVVACDGASSFVRKAVGLDFAGHTYPQDWLIADVRNVPSAIDHIDFFCDPARPHPHMPAPGGRQRWEFMLARGETREAMERPEVIRQLLLPWTGGREVELERVAVYRFHARVTDRFSAGRVLLAGDAAHVTPPFAGQGLVAGLRDAANLSWKLAWVVLGRADPAILGSYDPERRPHAIATVNMARRLGRLVMPRNRLAAFFVHGLAWLADRFPPTRKTFRDLAIKPSSTFERGLFSRRPGRARLVAGALFPQGLVAAGGRLERSDDVLGDRSCLVGFGVDPASMLPADLHDAWVRAGGAVLQICHRGQALNLAPPERRCEDVDGTFVPAAAPVGWAAVVRPDRRVMAEGPASESAGLLREALAMLGVPASGPGTRRAAAKAAAVS